MDIPNSDSSLSHLEPNRSNSKRYEFLKTIQEYVNLEKDLNTSYSLSSHTIRKLKLIRRGTFELQHEIQQCYDNDVTTSSEESKGLHGLFMKGLEPTLSLERKDELLLLQVCQIMLESLVEEIMDQETEPEDPTANSHDNDDEGIISHLEWFHHVYSIMEVDVLYEIAQISISSSSTEGEETPSWTLVRLLLRYLDTSQSALNSKTNDMDPNLPAIDHPRNISEQEYKWDKKKYLSLSIFSKILLTMEYVQKFCTSSSSTMLPIECLESSLGVNMGIGLVEHHKASMKYVIKLVMENIVSKVHMESDTIDESNIVLTSLVFLCVLYRTNPMEWMCHFKPIMNEMIQHLQSIVLRGVHESHSMVQKYLHSMATSTILLIQHHKGNINSHNLMHADDIGHLCQDAFARDTRLKKRNMKQSIAAQYILHLSMCRNENMKEIQSSGLSNFMQEMSSILVNAAASNSENLSIYFMIWTYMLTYNRYQFRSLLGEAWANSNALLKSILEFMTNKHSHASILSVFLRMLLSGPSCSRDTIGAWTWNSLLTDNDCQLQIQKLFDTYLIANDICRPSHLAVLQLYLDLLRHHKLCDLVGGYLNNDDINTFVEVLNITSWESLQCQACLGVASMLGMILMGHNEDDSNTVFIKRALTRFASNTSDGRMNDTPGSCHKGIFEYSISQSQSRDITRRVIAFQSILMRIHENDCTDFANAIFCSSLEREQRTIQSSEQISRCKKENEILSIKCKELNQVNTLLRDEIQTKEISYHHEFSKCRRQAQVDTLELTETCNGLQQQLSIAQKTLGQLKDEVSLQIESKLQSQKEVDKLKSEILELEKTLQNNHIVHDELQKQLNEKCTEMDKASKEIHDLSLNLKESKCNEQELVERHNDLKQRLEESLQYLISIAQIYSSKEEEHEKEYNIVKSQLEHVQTKLDKANSHSSNVNEKYIALQQKYQELKKRFEKEKQKVLQDKNKISEENSKKSIRKPMGTLAFMNSIHDTSLRLEKAKHSTSDGTISRSSIHRSSSHGTKGRIGEYDSSRKSKFRIVK